MHPEDLSSPPPAKVACSHQFAQDLLSLKLKVKTPQMSPGSQAHQDVASPSCIPSPAVSGTPLPRGMKSFLQDGLHVGQSPRTGSPSSAFFFLLSPCCSLSMKNNPRDCLSFPLQNCAKWTTLRISWFSSQHPGGASQASPMLSPNPLSKRSRVSQPHITPPFPWDALCLDSHRPVLS